MRNVVYMLKASSAAGPLIGGLMTSTILTLFVLPVLYSLFGKERQGDDEE